MKVQTINTAEGFEYSDAPQRSPEWHAIRAPRIGASEIGKYMAKGVKGQYLAGRKEVEKKIAFAKAFGVPFDGFKNAAMQAGVDMEDFVADQYAAQSGLELQKMGCAYNDWLVASPDRRIIGENGGVEVKWLFDVEFAELLLNGMPKDLHYDQMQGQIWAFNWDFVDYVAGNGNTGRFYVVRVHRDDDRIAEMKLERESVLAIKPMSVENIFEFNSTIPTIAGTSEDNPWTE